MTTQEFAVVVPVYNEYTTVRAVVEEVCRYIPLVVVVDDGSVDGSQQQLVDLPVQVLRFEVNRGKGLSLCRGAAYAIECGCRYIVTLDADGQHDPADIPSLIVALQKHPGALVIGARAFCAERRPPLRYLANRLADWAVSIIAGQSIKDTQSGFRIYPRALFEAVDAVPWDERFAFETRILIAAARLGFPIITVPIKAIYPKKGRSSYYRPVRDTVRIALLLVMELPRSMSAFCRFCKALLLKF